MRFLLVIAIIAYNPGESLMNKTIDVLTINKNASAAILDEHWTNFVRSNNKSYESPHLEVRM